MQRIANEQKENPAIFYRLFHVICWKPAHKWKLWNKNFVENCFSNILIIIMTRLW